jgi:hypothetical protein
MKGALVTSLAGLAALTVVFASAAQRQQPSAPPQQQRVDQIQAKFDALRAQGCIFVNFEPVPDEEGGGANAVFVCPQPTPSSLRFNGRL